VRNQLGRLLCAAVRLVPLAGLLVAAPANAAPTLAKSFAPSTIGPGSVSTLRFDILNTDLVGVRGLAFTDSLPVGMTVADPPNGVSTCSGTLSAPANGGIVTFENGSIAPSSSCFVSVDVTSSIPGTHTNVSGDLTWATWSGNGFNTDLTVPTDRPGFDYDSGYGLVRADVSGDLTRAAGSSNGASADLTVATDRPGFTKSFSPSTVFFGTRSRLTLTIDNSAGTAAAFGLTVTDNLPSGLVIADPASASTTCAGGVIGATPGGSVFSYGPTFPGDASVAAGASCTVGVDVIANAVGLLGNTTGELTSIDQGPVRSSGKASATLSVSTEQLTLTKTFIDDPTPPGETVTLKFEILNLNRESEALNVAFTDDLGAALSGLEAISFVNDCGGTISGTGLISFSGGTLDPGASCTISAMLQVPAEAALGAYFNITSAITAELGGRSLAGNPAADVLYVEPVPRLTKAFLDGPVGAGDSVTLEFTITNTSQTSSATDISFEDVFDVVLPTASSTPANGFCGPASTATYQPLVNTQFGPTPARLVISGAELAPSTSCTFSIDLDVAVGAPSGLYPNTTSAITATVGNESVTGSPASDELEVFGAPTIRKEFTDDPAEPDGTVNLQFTLVYNETAIADATGISFTDNLDATLPGLANNNGTLTDICGLGSQLSGTSNLSFSGGILSPGESCSFDVVLQVPPTAPAGSHTNTTSNLVAEVLGVPVLQDPATDDLQIGGVTLTKEFTDDPVLPGGNVNLRFTVTNISPVSDATDIFFQDNLGNVLSGLTSSDVPQSDICGTGSSLTLVGGDTLRLAGGRLLAGTSCTFDVSVQVPAGAPSETYVNTTTGFSASIEGATLAFDNATASLVVNNDFLALTKEFTDDPVVPGGTVTLEFTLTNLHPTETISDITFADDLTNTLSNLTAIGLPALGVCGAGSAISGTSLLSLTGGILPAGESCTFPVTLQVPADAPPDSLHRNTTNQVTGVVAGLPVTGNPATDLLEIANALNLTFTKAFSGAVFPGDGVTLTFEIKNLGSSDAAEISFADDLGSVLPGLVVSSSLPAFNVCGDGSTLDGTTVLVLSGGNLLQGGSCTFGVVLVVPADAIPGSYLNTTGDLRVFGSPVASGATGTLVIEQPTNNDADGDGVPNDRDICPGTAIPEDVPTRSLGTNRFALVDNDFFFDTTPPNGQGPRATFTTSDTAGCSCEQIIQELGLGAGHEKFGCSLGAMKNWVNAVNP